jgi:hypothetical protein
MNQFGVGARGGTTSMRKRRWQVEWRTQVRSDGMDRLGQMVKLVIDHAVACRAPDPTSRASPPSADANEERQEAEEMMT